MKQKRGGIPTQESENRQVVIQEVLNAKELAAFLKISLSQAYNLLGSDSFPTLHIGNRKLVTMQNLQDWMVKNTNIMN